MRASSSALIAAQALDVDPHPATLHAREHADQRHLDLVEEPLGILLGELLAQHRGDAQHRARALGRGLADAVLAVFEPGDERAAEILEGEVLDAMALARRVHDVGRDADVELRAAHRHPLAGEQHVDPLQVRTDLDDLRRAQPGSEVGGADLAARA